MACFLSLSAVDSILTWGVLSIGGTEANWYGLLLGGLPVWAILAIKTVLAGLFAFLIYKYRRRLFKSLNIGMGLVVAFNLFTLAVGAVVIRSVIMS